MQLQKGDILGHEFMGIVSEVGPEVKDIKKGERVVASFQIACGECSFCKEGLSSMCDRTNTSAIQEKLYGKPFAGYVDRSSRVTISKYCKGVTTDHLIGSSATPTSQVASLAAKPNTSASPSPT